MTKSMNHQYIDSLIDLGNKDSRIIAIDSDLGTSARTPQFKERFPNRYINCGIAEQNMVGVASGLAYEGNIPFAHSIASFMMRRCYDQLYQAVAIPNLNVIVVGVYAGLNGQDGNSHQSINDIALATALPNFTVVAPANSYEVNKLISQLVDVGPTYLRLSREHIKLPLDKEYEVKLGNFSRIKKGKDLALLSTGIMVNHTLMLSDKLSEKNIDASVYSVHTLSPFDNEELNRIREDTEKIVTLEEHLVDSGLGSKVVNSLEVPTKVCKIGLKNKLLGSAPLNTLLKRAGITINENLKIIEEYLNK